MVHADPGTVHGRGRGAGDRGLHRGAAGQRRDLAPIYSLIVATEPLDDATLGRRRAGRTADVHRSPAPDLLRPAHRRRPDRVRWPGRAVSLRFARPQPAFDRDAAGLRRRCERTLHRHVPGAARRARSPTPGAARSASPRDWHAGVGLDRETGFAWAGGYVGDGVATANLAGRTLADLITGADSEIVTLPWVGHRSRKWEPEPLRYLGINTGLRVMGYADRRETRTGHPSSMAKAFGHFLGG